MPGRAFFLCIPSDYLHRNKKVLGKYVFRICKKKQNNIDIAYGYIRKFV